MRYLKLRGLRGVSMRELRQAVSEGSAKGLVGLTFDDGYEDFLKSALPVLEEFGFSATLFVLGSMPTENNWKHYYEPKAQIKLLGPEGIREVAARGMEVGSHGMSHIRLGGLEPDFAGAARGKEVSSHGTNHIGIGGLEPALLEEEVNSSRHVLSEMLGEAVEGFCYPYGSVDAAAITAVRRAQYAYACSITKRIERNAYDLPRIPIAERDNLPRFAAKIEAFFRYRAAKKLLQRTTQFAAVRVDRKQFK
jgi:peptidoglycan/xylan/chitin deacetylase (PgdA/CDA1 family)